MKILFLLLAHDHPEVLSELAVTLSTAASDSRAIIHFDAAAKQEDYDLLQDALAGHTRISFTKQRIPCYWGDYSLVEAMLIALRETEEQGHTYDYAMTVSGSCLPCRPIRQLERFLTENDGMEFIEMEGPEWMVAGLRDERHSLYTLFPPRTRPHLEHFLFSLQRFLGVRRKLPAGIQTAKFGSQWWCLTGRTCRAILDFLAGNHEIEAFYRKTWIPDEMFFPTLVKHLAQPGRIAGYNLTYYQFTDRGKPIVFYDDHEDIPFSLGKFFYRKVSAEAKELRRRSLKLAHRPDGGEPFEKIDLATVDYENKAIQQTYFPVPGHVFYKDQLAGATGTLLKRVTKPYVVVCGSLEAPASLLPRADHTLAKATLAQRSAVPPYAPLQLTPYPYVVFCDSPETAEATVAVQDMSVFEPMGRPFMPEQVDFGQGRETFHGLHSDDAVIRDTSPALYFSRLLSRCAKIPVFLWMSGDKWEFLDMLAADLRCRFMEVRQW